MEKVFEKAFTSSPTGAYGYSNGSDSYCNYDNNYHRYAPVIPRTAAPRVHIAIEGERCVVAEAHRGISALVDNG